MKRFLLLLFIFGLHFSQPAKSTIQAYAQYFPGQPRPLGCDNFDYGMYSMEFYCRIEADPVIWVIGSSGLITVTEFGFDDIRLGDILDGLGQPESVEHYRQSWRLGWAHAYLYIRSLIPDNPVKWLTLTE